MIVFSNTNPLEVNEGAGQIIIEIDPIASEITEPLEVEISTISGSAISTDFTNSDVGVDFSAINNLVTTVDPDDPNTLVFSINLTEDEIVEPDENFQFQVTARDRSLNGTATVVIIDNDDIEEPESELEVEGLLPSIAIDSVEQLKEDSGNTDFEFSISLSEPSEETITVDYLTVDGTAESANRFESLELVDAADYIPSAGTLEFAPGETEKTIVVEVVADTEPLANETESETFFVNLSNASNANIDQVIGTGTILNNDLVDETDSGELPLLELNNQTFIEGDSRENTTQDLTVSLVDVNGEAVSATEDITFTYRTIDRDAAANLDYEFVSEQTAVINEDESSTIVDLTIIGDEIIESDESLIIALSDIDPNLVQFDSTQTELETVITIQDDDGVDDSDTEDISEPPEDELDDTETDSEDILDTEQDNDNGLMGDAVFRFLNSDTGGYLYTASENEREFIDNNLDNYELENSDFAGVDPDTDDATDVFRFFNSSTGGYFYTASENERDFIEDSTDEFVLEGVAFSAFATDMVDTIPVYRFYEINTGIHFYTADETERTFIEENLSNYNSEGIAFYALPALSDVI